MNIPNPPVAGQIWKAAVKNWIERTFLYLKRSRVLPDNHTVYAKYTPDGMILSAMLPKNISADHIGNAQRTAFTVKVMTAAEAGMSGNNCFSKITGGYVRYKSYTYYVNGYSALPLQIQQGEAIYVFIAKMFGGSDSNIPNPIIHFEIRLSKNSSCKDAIKIAHINYYYTEPEVFKDSFDYGPDEIVNFHDLTGEVHSTFIPETCYYDNSNDDIPAFLEDCSQKVVLSRGLVYIDGKSANLQGNLFVDLPYDSDGYASTKYLGLLFHTNGDSDPTFEFCSCDTGTIESLHTRDISSFGIMLAALRGTNSLNSAGNNTYRWSVTSYYHSGGTLWLNSNNHPGDLYNRSFTIKYDQTNSKIKVIGGDVYFNGETYPVSIPDQEISVSFNNAYFIYISYNRNSSGEFTDVQMFCSSPGSAHSAKSCLIAYFHAGWPGHALPVINEFYAGQVIRISDVSWETEQIRSINSSISSIWNTIQSNM